VHNWTAFQTSAIHTSFQLRRVSGVMNALVYQGPGQRAWETKPRPIVGPQHRAHDALGLHRHSAASQTDEGREASVPRG